MNNIYSVNLQNLPCSLRQLRKFANLTQKEVAEKLGLTPQSYQAYEAGLSIPTLPNFLSLCEFFDITPNELLDIS